MSGVASVPCPVRLGSIRSGGAAVHLHLFTRERNLPRVEKLLKQGVDVDCVNNLGQTSLYCACLLGLTAVAELLLRYGADPNRRCDDRSTPVHAAVFSSDTRLLSKLLDAGGDLRLHDDRGRMPRDWAEIGAQKHLVKMVGFIKSCMSVMRSLSESQSPGDKRVTPTSPETLVHSPSLLDLLKPVSDRILNKKVTAKTCVSDAVQCFGFGKLCVEKAGMSAGALASVPLILDSELLQAEDEALHTFSCGSFTKMTNYSWRGNRVSVKELQMDHIHRHAERHANLDLLITELGFCCQLFHPHLLQLMAVSSSTDLLQNRLVYERVHVGSLYTLLYHQRAEFPLLQVDKVLSLILQVCEALFYLHGRSLVLRSLSSHSVVVVHPGVAKVTGFGFMVPSNCSPSSMLAVPVMLYNWAAPEVIQRKSCTEKADLYSLCALMQELYTDAVPWGSVKPRWIKKAVDAGQCLCADPAVPQPYYDLLLKGLKPRAPERTCSLQDLRYTLRSDLRKLRETRTEVRPLLPTSSPHRWSTDSRHHGYTEHPDERQVAEQDVQVPLQEQSSFHTKPKPIISNVQNWDSNTCCQLPQDECCLSNRFPSLEEEDMEEETKTKEQATESFTSDHHINSIILNLKVSQVLLQQVESSLELSESRMMGNTSRDVTQSDEPDGLDGQRDRQVVVLDAVGPPSRYRPPSRYFQEVEEDVIVLSSAAEDLESSADDQNSSEEDWRRSGGRIRFTEECNGWSRSSVPSTSQEQTDHLHAAHNWTGGVSAAVTRITHRFLSCAAGRLVGTGDNEEEQQPLMNAQEDTHLEQLFKSFAAGVQSDSEDSTDFHTINRTFTRHNAVWEVKGQHTEEDYTHSPVEPSSIYTPQHNRENTKTKEERSQTASPEDDPDVTQEVCCPNMTGEMAFRDYQSLPDEPQHTEVESAPLYVHTSRSNHLRDIADLSSITCSPAHFHETMEQNGAHSSPHSTRMPARNSTPFSLHTHWGQHHSGPYSEVCVSTLVPHMQSLIETSPWGSTESLSLIQTSERWTRPPTIHSSALCLLQAATGRRVPHQDSHTPGPGNPEFTTDSCGVRDCTEKKSQEHSDTAADLVLIVEEKESKPTETAESVCNTTSSAEETKRAHASLDEVLLDLLENPDAQRTPGRTTVMTDEGSAELTCGRSAIAERLSCEQMKVIGSNWSRETNTFTSGDLNGGSKWHITQSGFNQTERLFWSTYPPKRDARPR